MERLQRATAWPLQIKGRPQWCAGLMASLGLGTERAENCPSGEGNVGVVERGGGEVKVVDITSPLRNEKADRA